MTDSGCHQHNHSWLKNLSFCFLASEGNVLQMKCGPTDFSNTILTLSFCVSTGRISCEVLTDMNQRDVTQFFPPVSHQFSSAFSKDLPVLSVLVQLVIGRSVVTHSLAMGYIVHFNFLLCLCLNFICCIETIRYFLHFLLKWGVVFILV